MNSIPQDLETIVHIGAGEGRELPAYLNSNAKRIVLVEPNPVLAERLRQHARNEARVEVLEVAVSDNPEQNQLREYNLPEASSLYEPSGLRSFYPGLQVHTSHTVKVLAPDSLVAELQLAKGPNLLVVQAPGAEQAVVEGLAEKDLLKRFEHIWLTAPEQAYFDSDSQWSAILPILESAGYTHLPGETDNHEWPSWVLHRHPLAERVETLSEQLRTIEEEKQTLAKELASAREQLHATSDAKQKLEQELEQRTEWHQNRKKEAETLKEALEQERKAHEETANKLKETQGWLTNRKKQVADFEEKVKDLQARVEEQTTQNSRFDELAERLTGVTRQLSNHFDKKLDRTSQTIERTLGLQSYLQTGNLPVNQPALSKISADLGLYLAEKVETRQYDLIIEFGSGASTSFLARTVMKRLEKSRRDDSVRLTHDSNQASDKNLAFIAPDDADLPKRVVSFEHRKDVCERLERNLHASGLKPVVDVCHAPLIDFQHQQQDYLHYDCDAKLERIAHLYEGRSARLLVLVSGPPLKAGLNAPFPALPRLLNRLGTHELDIVLQGTRAPQVQSITAEWLKLLEQRGTPYRQEPIDLEAGTTLFAINQR